MDSGEITGLISVEIRKALDSIDHKTVLKKIQDQFGILNPELNWFQSYLTIQSQVCIVDRHISAEMKVTRGDPQGSILGPLIFLLYVNDP